MSRYNEDLDYLIPDIDISEKELEEIITEADKIISGPNCEKDKIIEAYLKKVQCLQKLYKYTESKEFIDKILDSNPNMPEALVRLGNVYDENKKYNEAIDCITKAIGINPDYAYAYLLRGIAKHNLSDYNGAIEDYDKAIELKPDYAATYYNRGNAKRKLSDDDGAIKDYDKAIELKPDYAAAYNNRGNAKRKLSDYDGAIKDYDKAIELKPDYAIVYNNRGVTYRYKGDFNRAIEDYDKAIEINPQYDNARENRLNTYHAKDENLVMPLVKIRKNQKYMEALKKDIKKVVPFLGAGASMPYGYYTWRGLLKEIFIICCRYDKVDSKDKDDIEKHIADGNYIAAASEMDRIFPNVISAVCTAIESVADDNCIKDVTVNRRSILSEYLHLFPNETCLTTNYDTVVEDILELQNKRVKPVYAIELEETSILPVVSEYTKLRKQKLGSEEDDIIFDKKVYYLHGVYDLPPSITLSKLHYDDYYGTDGDIKSNLRRRLPLALHGIYHNTTFLYIGCGMIVQQDRILKVIREFCRNLPNSPFSYALLNANEIVVDKNAVDEIAKTVNEIAKTEELFENWEVRSKEVQEKLNTALKEKTDELRNMNVRVIWYSAPENSADGHESAKRQLFKYILDDTRKKVIEEKKENQRFMEDKAKIEAEKKKQERDRLNAEFNNISSRGNTEGSETTTPKEDVKGISLSEEQLKQVEEFFKSEILMKTDSSTKHEIKFPMYKIEGELYKIYLVSENGKFYLSDDGTTYAELDKIFELSEPDVFKNLLAILRQYGCRIQLNTNSFIIECTLQDVHIKMSYLIQAISFLLNMKIFYV